MLQAFTPSFEAHWILIYFVVLVACAYLWGPGGNDGGVGFEEGDRD